jgi:hypothetical protein
MKSMLVVLLVLVVYPASVIWFSSPDFLILVHGGESHFLEWEVQGLICHVCLQIMLETLHTHGLSSHISCRIEDPFEQKLPGY